MTTNGNKPDLKIVSEGHGQTRVPSKDEQEILILLSKIPMIGPKLAPAYAPYVNPYNREDLINVADVVPREDKKGGGPTILFMVVKGSVEIGRHNSDGEFSQYAILRAQSGSTTVDTMLFSPDVKLKRLSLKALEEKTLVLMMNRDQFLTLMRAVKKISMYRDKQEKTFHQIAAAMPISQGYRYDVFYLRHLVRTFVSYVLRATVGKQTQHIDFLTRKIVSLLDEYNQYKALRLDQQIKILAKMDELKKEDGQTLVQEVTADSLKQTNPEDPKNVERIRDLDLLLTASSFTLHQDMLDLFFTKE